MSSKFEARAEFVRKCGEVLKEAKPHLISCELKYGKDIEKTAVGERLHPDEEYVVVNCDNGHAYNVCVDGDSLMGIACDIFKQMGYK